MTLYGLVLPSGLEAQLEAQLLRLPQSDVRTSVTRATVTADPQEDRQTVGPRRCVRTSPGQCGGRRHHRGERVTPRAVQRDREEVAVKVRSKSNCAASKLPPSSSCPRRVVLWPSPCACHWHAAGNHSSCDRCGRSRRLLLSAVLGVLALDTVVLGFALAASSVACRPCLHLSISCPCLCPS